MLKLATIAPMGRRRANARTDLEPRLYEKHGAFHYVHRSGKWECLGKDKAAANAKARLFNDPDDQSGTLVYWLKMFVVDCEARVKAKTLAQRTLEDYDLAVNGIPAKEGREGRPGALSVFFAPPITPLDVDPSMIDMYLKTNAELGRPVPANREKAALSSCFSWLIRNKKVPGLTINPCLRASGIKRNPETKRDRYVTHDEYRDVWAVAHPSVRLMMELTYRTLQRPESDIITWTSADLVTEDRVRKITFRQHKTGRVMKIALTPELVDMIKAAIGEVPTLRQALVHTRDGKPYSYDGISAMLKRAITKANQARKLRGVAPMPSFGFRDLKGKGATDMWRDGVPIETIQQLCGHSDKSTTEIYVKQRWHETVNANARAIG